MKTTTYNTRTLAACAKRLRYLESAFLGVLPEWTIVWRWREGYRLQVAGEHHEPGGCVCDLASSIHIDRMIERGETDAHAYDCLEALLECSPQEFDKDSLIHLSCTTDTGQSARIGEKAFVALCEQAMKRNLVAKQYLQTAH